MLSKQNYLQVNSVTFSNQKLTKQQKEQKYQQYVRRHTMQMNREKVLVPLIPRTVKNKQRTQVKKMPIQQSKIKFSDCLLRYAQASIDPFSNIVNMPCIPDTISTPSYKFKSFVDVDMTVGTGGVGFAVFNPWTMVANNFAFNLTTSDYPVVVTESTYTSGSYTWGSADITAGDVTGYNSNSEFTGIQIQAGAYRLVAAGIQSEYTGQLLNQSGVITTIQWDGLKFIPQVDIGIIRTNHRTQVCANARENRCYARYEPTSSSNFDYADVDNYMSSINHAIIGNYYYPIGIFVSGATPGITFRIRAVAFFELQLLQAPVTPSDSDPIGFAAFQSARTSVLPSPEPKVDLLSILKKTAMNIGNTITGFAPQIGTILGSAFGNPALGMVAGNATKDIIDTLFG